MIFRGGSIDSVDGRLSYGTIFSIIKRIIWFYNTVYNHKCNNIQLLHLNEINMRFYGAEYNNIE
jgi:hypothetical protein